jgi:hypothetical protein
LLHLISIDRRQKTQFLMQVTLYNCVGNKLYSKILEPLNKIESKRYVNYHEHNNYVMWCFKDCNDIILQMHEQDTFLYPNCVIF